MRQHFFLFVILFLFSITLKAQDLEDVVYLKDGSILKGIIVEQVPNESIKIQLASGEVRTLVMTEISKFTREPIKTVYNGSSLLSARLGLGLGADYAVFIQDQTAEIGVSFISMPYLETNVQDADGGEVHYHRFSKPAASGWFYGASVQAIYLQVRRIEVFRFAPIETDIFFGGYEGWFVRPQINGGYRWRWQNGLALSLGANIGYRLNAIVDSQGRDIAEFYEYNPVTSRFAGTLTIRFGYSF
jgi:hypothetical protein